MQTYRNKQSQAETGTRERYRADVEEDEEQEILIGYPLQVHNLSPTDIYFSLSLPCPSLS